MTSAEREVYFSQTWSIKYERYCSSGKCYEGNPQFWEASMHDFIDCSISVLNVVYIGQGANRQRGLQTRKGWYRVLCNIWRNTYYERHYNDLESAKQDAFFIALQGTYKDFVACIELLGFTNC